MGKLLSLRDNRLGYFWVTTGFREITDWVTTGNPEITDWKPALISY